MLRPSGLERNRRGGFVRETVAWVPGGQHIVWSRVLLEALRLCEYVPVKIGVSCTQALKSHAEVHSGQDIPYLSSRIVSGRTAQLIL